MARMIQSSQPASRSSRVALNAKAVPAFPRFCERLEHARQRSRPSFCPVHTVQHRWGGEQISNRAEQAEKTPNEHEAAPDKHDEEGGDRKHPCENDHELYRRAPAVAHSETIFRASSGSTTVATPGMLAIRRLRPW